MSRLTPYPEQQKIVDAIACDESGGSLLAAELGTGKTISAVWAALARKAEVTLIVGPLHVQSGWERAVKDETGTELKIINAKARGKRNFASLLWGEPGFYFVGREYMMRRSLRGAHVDMLIIDECQFFANRANASFAAVTGEWRPFCDYALLLSATPFGSGFAGAWSIGQILWPQWMKENGWGGPSGRGGKGEGFWKKWAPEFAVVKDDFFAGKVVTGEQEPGKFFSIMPSAFTMKSRVGPAIHKDIMVDLHPSQARTYRSMVEDSLAWLGENPLVAELPITKRVRQRQATLGDLKVETTLLSDGEFKDVVSFEPDGKSAKWDALKSLVESLPSDEKMLITTDSAKFAKLTAERMQKTFGSTALWSGEVSREDREEVREAFSTGDLRFIVATIQTIESGVDGLQNNCRLLTILSESDNIIFNEQLVGRLARTGQKRQVIVYHIKANPVECSYTDSRGKKHKFRDSVDLKQYDNLRNNTAAMRAMIG
jgi:hypothetical protein